LAVYFSEKFVWRHDKNHDFHLIHLIKFMEGLLQMLTGSGGYNDDGRQRATKRQVEVMQEND